MVRTLPNQSVIQKKRRISNNATRFAVVAWGPSILFCGSALLPVDVAIAQDMRGSEPVDTAGNRPQPAYDAVGIRLGSIRVLPTLGLTGSWDSNVLARSEDAVSDFSATLVPAVRAEWNTPRRQLSLDGEIRLRRYAELHRQNDEQYRAQAAARFEISGNTSISANLGWADVTATRGTFENGFQIGDPLRMRELNGNLSVRQRFNRLTLVANAAASRFRYGDVRLDDGTLIDQSFRNGHQIGGSVLARYEVGPRLSLVSRVTANKFDYSDPSPLTNRDATAYSVTGGISYELTQLLEAEVDAGIQKHNFRNPAFGDISGLALNARLRWYPTPLLSVRFDVSQRTTTSSFNATSAVVVTSGRLSADYELRRNLLLSADVNYSHEKYGAGNNVSGLLTLSGQAAWKANRWLRVTGRASYDRRGSNSDVTVPEFDALRFMLTLTVAR